MMKLFVVLAVCFVCACASPAGPQLDLWPKSAGNRITGGQNAVRLQFPYQISFQWGILGIFQHVCGGSLVSPTYVITAGHCITELPGLGSTRVVAGILNINEDGEVRNVASSLVHPSYGGGVGPNDLALIRLASAFSYSDAIQPIGLPVAGAEPEGRALLSGWGSTSTGILPSMPSILQYVDIPILSYSECADALAALFGTPDPLDVTNVCTGPLYDGISACSGDSGGPLAQQESNELIGIVSWGVSPCGYAGAPSVYVKVSSYIDFIRANIPDLPASKNE